MTSRTINHLITVLILAAGATALAGPLNPPAGPVAPTMKTLTEVEPRTAISAANTPGNAGAFFVITQPGSYYLTGSVTGVSGKNGIAIQADNVTLDLNGFAVVGVPGATTGVLCNGAHTCIEIFGGTVRSWTNAGIDCNSTSNSVCRNVRLSADSTGLVAGTGMTVSDCSASGNTSNDFVNGTRTLFQRCVADGYQATGIGFNTFDNCTFLDCSVSNHAVGIYPSVGALVSRCAFYDNAVGLQLISNTHVTGCTFISQTQNFKGIAFNANAFHDCIQDNTFAFNAQGAVGVQFAGTGHVLVRNQFVGCPTPTAAPYSADDILGPILHPSDMAASSPTTPLNPWANFAN